LAEFERPRAIGHSVGCGDRHLNPCATLETNKNSHAPPVGVGQT
jgi:hypothetical protein